MSSEAHYDDDTCAAELQPSDEDDGDGEGLFALRSRLVVLVLAFPAALHLFATPMFKRLRRLLGQD